MGSSPIIPNRFNMLPNDINHLLTYARKFVLLERNTKLPGPYQPEVALEWRDLDSWAVVIDRTDVLNEDLTIVWEPTPSNRNADFVSKTRFSFEKAWLLAEKFIVKNDYKSSLFLDEKT